MRPDNHLINNRQNVFTVLLALDLPVHKGKTWTLHTCGRMTFDYVILGQEERQPSHRFIISWWPMSTIRAGRLPLRIISLTTVSMREMTQLIKITASLYWPFYAGFEVELY